MKREEGKIILSKEEFVCFLLIYASHVDYVFSDSEKNYILNQCPVKTFEKMEKLFHSQPDFTCLQLILSHKSLYFSNPEQLNEIIQQLHGIFNVDGDFSSIEKNFVPFFLKMTEMESHGS